jgi:hypothetical protein
VPGRTGPVAPAWGSGRVWEGTGGDGAARGLKAVIVIGAIGIDDKNLFNFEMVVEGNRSEAREREIFARVSGETELLGLVPRWWEIDAGH